MIRFDKEKSGMENSAAKSRGNEEFRQGSREPIAEKAAKLHQDSVRIGIVAQDDNRAAVIKEAVELQKHLRDLLAARGITLKEVEQETHRTSYGFYFPANED